MPVMTASTTTNGTIVAQATAQGSGAIAIIRISGPMAKKLLGLLFTPSQATFSDFVPWRVYHGIVHDLNGTKIDDVLCFYMPGPRTYTGEDCAEIHCHGGQLIVSAIIEALLEAGACPARRGEFTHRAFLNGRMDLSQAEAVAEMIAAPSRTALGQSLRRLNGELGRRVGIVRETRVWLRLNMSLSVDFPEDEVESLDWTERIFWPMSSLQAGHCRIFCVEWRVQRSMRTAQGLFWPDPSMPANPAS